MVRAHSRLPSPISYEHRFHIIETDTLSPAKLLLIFLVLWLPIKPAVAFVMPFCNQNAGMAAPAHHGQVPHTDASHESNQAQENACESPVLCHLVSLAILLSVPVVIAPDSDKLFSPDNTPHLNEFVPDEFDQPPRAPFA